MPPTPPVPPVPSAPPPPPPPAPSTVRVHAPTGLPLAGFGRRLGARIIDYLLLSVLVWLLTFGIVLLVFMAYPNLEEPSSTFDQTFGLLFAFGWGVAAFLYDWFFVAASGRTPGKMMTGLRVINANGAPLSQGPSVLRSAAFGLPHSLPCLGHTFVFVSSLFIAGDDNAQALWDKMAQTVVVVSR